MDLVYEVATRCHNLTKLNISGVPDIKDDVLWCLAENCPHLSYLNLKGCRQVRRMFKLSIHSTFKECYGVVKEIIE